MLDVEFEPEHLPELYNALEIDGRRAASIPVTLVAEVQQHIGRNQVRAVAMSSTDGVVRGMEVVDTGAADHGAGRRGGARPHPERARRAGGRRRRRFPTDVERWPIHRQAPDFVDLEPKTEIFETGIKVVDLIAPFVKGGKIGLFGGAGVGKTVVIQELINNVAEGTRRQVGVLRRGRAHARGERPLPRVQGSGHPRLGAR